MHGHTTLEERLREAHCPVHVQKTRPEWPTSVAYPIEAVIATLKCEDFPGAWFASSVAYQITAR